MPRSALALALLLLALPARADEVGHTDPSIGGRGLFYRPVDADHGTWNPGGQVKMRLGDAYGLQGSVDVTHHSAAGANYRVIPAQLTLLGYFSPDQPFSFFMLAGVGWYFTHVDGPGAHSETLFREHVGLGAEIMLSRQWSVDASYRFLWNCVWRYNDYLHPWGSGYHRQGDMVVLGLNRLF